MYKKGMSKTKFKNRMRMFWTKRWKYQSPDWWLDRINSKSFSYGGIYTTLLLSALDKMVLDKKIDKAQCKTFKEMLRSDDKENHMLAVLAMQRFHPKKFKSNVEKLPRVQNEA